MANAPIRTVPLASKKRPSDDQAAVQAFVGREVHYCVSDLVHTLASAHAAQMEASIYTPKGAAYPAHVLGEQAAELAAPVLDYESAAREAGWAEEPGRWIFETEDGEFIRAVNAQDACDDTGTDPHFCEVYEHWLVSDWMADKLAAKGEKVDTDFAGLPVWARTCTGQAIMLDGVICEIFDDLHSDTAEG